jgi:hypothetical protein
LIQLKLNANPHASKGEQMNKLGKLCVAAFLGLNLCCLPLVAEDARPEENATILHALALQALRAEIFGPIIAMSCYAEWNCPGGTVLQCSCPGAGTCTSNSSNGGQVICDCAYPDPDTTQRCPLLCPPNAVCTSDSQCGDGGLCINKRCLC